CSCTSSAVASSPICRQTDPRSGDFRPCSVRVAPALIVVTRARTEPMRSPSTFIEVLQAHAARRAARPVYTLVPGGSEGGVLTYESLDVRARAIAAMLQGEGLERRRVLLLFEPGLPFIEAFFGCLYAGAI